MKHSTCINNINNSVNNVGNSNSEVNKVGDSSANNDKDGEEINPDPRAALMAMLSKRAPPTPAAVETQPKSKPIINPLSGGGIAAAEQQEGFSRADPLDLPHQ